MGIYVVNIEDDFIRGMVAGIMHERGIEWGFSGPLLRAYCSEDAIDKLQVRISDAGICNVEFIELID